MESVKGVGRDQKVIKKVVPFTVGFGSLPWAGGMLDQPYRMMEFFEMFLESERRTTYETLGK